MNVEAIIRDFEQAPPRKVCFKRNSPEEGVGLQPFSYMEELAGCGGILLVILVIAGVIIGNGAIWIAVIYACILAVLAILFVSSDLSNARHHKKLARYGFAAIGKVTHRTDVQEHDDTPGIATRVTIEYTFETRSGERITGRRDTISGWYSQLVQDGSIVIIYLSERPEVHEPYNSLRYRICTEYRR